MCAKLLNSLGLVLGMIGVVIIFIWGPPLPDFEESVGLGLSPGTVLADGTRISDIIADNSRRKRKHNFLSRFGLALILLGFAAQFAAVWV
jgi:hypothetical protein